MIGELPLSLRDVRPIELAVCGLHMTAVTTHRIGHMMGATSVSSADAAAPAGDPRQRQLTRHTLTNYRSPELFADRLLELPRLPSELREVVLVIVASATTTTERALAMKALEARPTKVSVEAVAMPNRCPAPDFLFFLFLLPLYTAAAAVARRSSRCSSG
jgi:hypothetical protein